MIKKRIKRFYILFTLLFIFCEYSLKEYNEKEYLDFILLDVGQGLSQIFVFKNEAIAFDMGPVECAEKWLSEYRRVGKPSIKAIVISHRDIDHSGGLGFLDSSVKWNGILITSQWEDTIFLKSLLTKWNSDVHFFTKEMNDTIFFNSKCFIKCLWPPREIEDNYSILTMNTNHYSLVFHCSYNNTSILLTGDIDSLAAKYITTTYKTELYSDIVIVPHHGSSTSLFPLLYQYASPSVALLSYGQGNSYDHPSLTTLDMLGELGIEYFTTEKYGHLRWKSNGYYWMKEF